MSQVFREAEHSGESDYGDFMARSGPSEDDEVAERSWLPTEQEGDGHHDEDAISEGHGLPQSASMRVACEPEECEQMWCRAIQGAKSMVGIAAYVLTSRQVVQSVIIKARGGVKCYVLLDEGQLKQSGTRAAQALSQAGVYIRTSTGLGSDRYK
jgi:phosphatidylserine/phosphatidylglycerophosphate/cardiolipin synthase-like enzyme